MKLYEILEDEEDVELNTVKAKLEIKDVAGDKYEKTYNLVYDTKSSGSAQRLQEFREEVRSKIMEDKEIKYFDVSVLCDKIVCYKITRVKDNG